MKREINKVPARNLHYSSPLPSGRYNDEPPESVKQVGIQQPIIVRPIPGKQDEYEIIDGLGRLMSLSDDEQVPAGRALGKRVSKLKRLEQLLLEVNTK